MEKIAGYSGCFHVYFVQITWDVIEVIESLSQLIRQVHARRRLLGSYCVTL